MVGLHYNHGVGKVGAGAAVLVAALVSLIALHTPTMADAVSWVSPTPPIFAIDEVQKPDSPPPTCSPEQLYLGNDLAKSSVCITSKGSWRYGKYTYYAPGSSYREEGYAIGFGYDAKMYRLTGISTMVQVPGSNAMAYRTTGPWPDSYLNVVRDFPSKLTRTVALRSGSYVTEYSFQQQPDVTLKYPNGKLINVGAVGASLNGKWLAAELPQSGIVLINLETLAVKRISRLGVTYGHGTNPGVQFAVSNDGRHVAVMGHNFHTAVIESSPDCGDALTDGLNEHTPMTNPCQEFDAYTYLLSNGLPRFSFGYNPSFDEDAGKLNFRAGSYDGPSVWVTLTAAGYNAPPQLDYLALGDSYSSGEGDTEINPATKKKYYLPHTDVEGADGVPEEMCHLSSRSYPFLLGNAMNIPAYRMKSIACSGAVGRTDYVSSNEGYNGQNDRLSALKDAGAVVRYKTTALNEFIPGRNQQIEFVKEYQPKAITLTAGGNDANFGGVLEACAFPLACHYATTAEGKAKVGMAISEQYTNLIKLYKQLQEVSPSTKIYVIGYPQFFAANSNALCPLNVRFRSAERLMAHEAVVYMNLVIQAAAQAVGVKYIDIEDSLGNHTLCGGEDAYMTGLAGSGKLTTKLRNLASNESFHPNAKGHRAIAEAIQGALGGKIFAEYDYCGIPDISACQSAEGAEPTPTAYFADAMFSDPIRYVPASILNQEKIQKGTDTLAINLSSLEPGSKANIVAFSAPTDLGEYQVDAKGNLTVNIPIPEELPAGMHTLQVETKTFSGESIALWQVFSVIGRAGDVDENGVSDDSQSCLFVSDSGVDADTDGIDDVCDPEIGPETMSALTTTQIKKGSGGDTSGLPKASFSERAKWYETSSYLIGGIGNEESGILSVISKQPESRSGASRDQEAPSKINILPLISLGSIILPLLIIALLKLRPKV